MSTSPLLTRASANVDDAQAKGKKYPRKPLAPLPPEPRIPRLLVFVDLNCVDPKRRKHAESIRLEWKRRLGLWRTKPRRAILHPMIARAILDDVERGRAILVKQGRKATNERALIEAWRERSRSIGVAMNECSARREAEALAKRLSDLRDVLQIVE